MSRRDSTMPSLVSRCPLCGGSVAVRWPGVDVWRCRSCGLLFRNPLPAAGELEELYSSSWSAPTAARAQTGGTTERLARLYAARLQRSAGLSSFEGLKILDFGAGRGDMLAALRELGADACGIEPFGHEFLKEKGLPVFRSLRDLPSDRRFDGVVSIDVVEHLAEPWHDLAALRGLLRPGGFLYVSTMNTRGLNALLSRSRWREVRKKGHLLFFTDRTLRRALSSAGFETAERLRWHVRHHRFALRRAFDFALQSLGLDGELRFLVRRREPPSPVTLP